MNASKAQSSAYESGITVPNVSIAAVAEASKSKRKEWKAENTIPKLFQRTNVSQYVVVFQTHAQSVRWNDAALMHFFRQGLKDDVKDKLVSYNGTIDTLRQLQNAAVDIDNRLHK